jgi:hypothetical protein
MLSDGISKPEERPHEKAPEIDRGPDEQAREKKSESQGRASLTHYPKMLRKSSYKGELK